MSVLKTVVAGHVCLDIIPQFLRSASRLDEWVVPGKLVDMGPAVIATGGLAEVVARETSVIEHVDPWLTLKGLRLIYDLNRGTP